MKVDNFDLIKKHINTSDDGNEFYASNYAKNKRSEGS